VILGKPREVQSRPFHSPARKNHRSVLGRARVLFQPLQNRAIQALRRFHWPAELDKSDAVHYLAGQHRDILLGVQLRPIHSVRGKIVTALDFAVESATDQHVRVEHRLGLEPESKPPVGGEAERQVEIAGVDVQVEADFVSFCKSKRTHAVGAGAAGPVQVRVVVRGALEHRLVVRRRNGHEGVAAPDAVNIARREDNQTVSLCCVRA